MSRLRPAFFFSSALSMLALAGCDGDRAECSFGTSEACTCADGASGIRVCQVDETFGMCTCGGVDGGRVDSGTTMRDAGTPRDTGTPGEDGGVTPTDSGTTTTDSGTTTTDSGTTTTDSGTTTTDSGTTTTDSGTTTTDSGTTTTDAGRDAGTTASDAGTATDGGSVSTCDFSGYTPTSTATLVNDTDATMFHRMSTAAEDMFIEVYFGFGAAVGPRTVTFTGENYNTCLDCLIIFAECPSGRTDPSACGAVYLAQSGTMNYSGLTGNTLAGTLNNVVLAEVTLSGITSTVVPGGREWCIPSLAFTGTGPACRNGTCDAGESLASCPADCADACGNGLCEAGETAAGCAVDCTGSCGDGFCTRLSTGTENESNCPADCLCEVFGADTCTGTNVCTPRGRLGDLTIVGECSPEAAGEQGDSCTSFRDCGERLFCVNLGPGGTCEPACDPFRHLTGATGCGGGLGCYPLGDGAGGLGVLGLCDATCDDFSTVGCSSGEWCSPDLFSRDIGFCSAIGALPSGSTCTADVECLAGSLCLGSACTPVCDSDGSGCASGELCVPGSFASDPAPLPNVSWAFGTCEVGCNFDGGGACASGTCLAQELVSSPADFCAGTLNLAHGAACPSGSTALTICNGLGACGDPTGSGTLTCFDLCRVGLGASALGSTTHPDCPGGTTCTGTAGTTLGVCR